MDGLLLEITVTDSKLTEADTERLRIRLALNNMQESFDSRMLMFACLARAAAICELLIAADKATPDMVTKWFAEACNDAMTPRQRSEPPKVSLPDSQVKASGKAN